MLMWLLVGALILAACAAVLMWKWPAIRAFFKDSETIFLARLTYVAGLVIAAGAGMDWSPLLALAQDGGFDPTQAFRLGVFLFAQGIILEIARRARDPEL